ncbi:RDD family protein [Curtobacterium sp. Leaf261]|uniref:RDD family protein n=1 Tax=Curtobacterium sp. Leaf261 TaxID=1736311 RepID=UPI0006FA2BC5|nr:RDD family protein [Curtobacterium sp. Leaf261]KQO62217.1 hypothetical protein ASF23_10370 [Curtobacterium sp. Leaf261]
MTTTALETMVPILTCGACGAPTTSGQRFCTDCGVLLGRAALVADVDLLRGVVPAHGGRVSLARLVDTVVCLVAGGVAALLLLMWQSSAPGRPHPVTAAIVGAVLGIVVGAISIAVGARRSGRGPGGLLVGTRAVDATTGLPAGPFRAVHALVTPSLRAPRTVLPFRGPWARATGTMTASLRDGGRDPLAPASAPLGVTYGAAAASGVRPRMGGTAPGSMAHGTGSDAGDLAGSEATRIGSAAVGAVAHAPLPADADVPEGAAVITFDSGAVHWFTTTCVIGRNPGGEDGVTVIAVPDLSRTLSKTHVALVRGDRFVTVRDLGSTNGTSLVHPDGHVQELLPDVDVDVPPTTTVRIGDHAFRLDRTAGAAPRDDDAAVSGTRPAGDVVSSGAHGGIAPTDGAGR